MNRNAENHFQYAPMSNIERSKMPYVQPNIGTCKMAELVPFFSDETIQPMDTFQINCNMVLRLLTPITPTMANMFVDLFFFFVPMRLVWEHTEEYFGENPNGAWIQETEYYTPIINSGENGFAVGSIMDYLYGAPVNVANLEVSALSLRAYVKCYNDWFRDQNWIAPKEERTDDSDITFDNTDPTKGGVPFKIAKYHDIITSLLPAPQKGTAVSLPLGISAPVTLNSNTVQVYGNGKTLGLQNASGNHYGFGLLNGSTNGIAATASYNKTIGTSGDYNIQSTVGVNVGLGITTEQNGQSGITGKLSDTSGTADLTTATASTINSLREAFAYQRIMEKMARGGSRYTEIIKSFFGVNASYARLQRAEYLGGKSIPLDMIEIAQTSSTDATSPQGNVAAMGKTVISDRMFTKSFDEWGILIGMFAIRQRHYYQQGIEKQYKIRRKYERYFPQLAHLGEQPVYREEIYATGTEENDKTVLGFQEAWWFMRYRMAKITGYMRSGITGSLDFWHQGDYYTSAPVISEDFINETDTYLRRTLAVTDATTHQFQFATQIHGSVTRAMPTYSIPGLIDHF